MNAVAELTDRIASLTIAQAVELKNLLKEKYGIEPAGPGAVVVPLPKPDPGTDEGEPAAPTEFTVVLEGTEPAKKINVIKAVRELTGQGLGEAKATVEGAPRAIKEGVDKKTADELKKQLEAAGGRVSIKAG